MVMHFFWWGGIKGRRSKQGALWSMPKMVNFFLSPVLLDTKKPLRRRKPEAVIDEYVYPPHFVPTITGQAACRVDASGSPDLRRLYQKAAVPYQTKLWIINE